MGLDAYVEPRGGVGCVWKAWWVFVGRELSMDFQMEMEGIEGGWRRFYGEG